MAEEEVLATQEALPEEIRHNLENVLLLLEELPDDELIADGFEPDLLGIFEGPEWADTPSGDGSSPRIRLFLRNIWDYAEGDEKTYREEVRLTYLHEIGHLFGWGEDDLEVRGLG